MTKKIYVGKLSPVTTNQNLFDHFSKSGSVVEARVAASMNPKANAGYGYVTMSSDNETKNAITKLNRSKLLGMTILVTEAHFLDQSGYGGGLRRIKRYR